MAISRGIVMVVVVVVVVSRPVLVPEAVPFSVCVMLHGFLCGLMNM